MAVFTSFFDIYEQLADAGAHVDTTYKTRENSSKTLVELSDDNILAELNALFAEISTLEDYRILVNVVKSLEDMLTIRILFLLFKALIPVEERVWHSAGMNPPIRDIVTSRLNLLLDQYTEFAYELESELINWAKENGYFTEPDKYEFLEERNEIYKDYIILAGRIINAFGD